MIEDPDVIERPGQLVEWSARQRVQCRRAWRALGWRCWTGVWLVVAGVAAVQFVQAARYAGDLAWDSTAVQLLLWLGVVNLAATAALTAWVASSR